jgi:AcrR family transcriptional regulator
MSQFDEPGEEQAMAATPTQMLDVAEHLFAENGLDNVSIREIVRASGQNNLSAAHYHFGSREALIGAMLARRIRVINAIRHKRLDELMASGRDGSVHAIVAATVGVLAEVVQTLPWGPDYVRVVSQALFSPKLQVWSLLDDKTMSGHTRCTAMLRRLLPQLPIRVFKDRIWILNNETAYNIARWVQSNGAVTAASSRRYASLVRNTIDFLAAGMAAPAGKPDTDGTVDK